MLEDLVYFKTFGSEKFAPLLFLHGFMGSSRDWHPVMKEFSSRFYCIGLDLPGHGKTKMRGHNHRYSIPAAAETIRTVLERLKLARVTLIGYSMGGRVALYFALRYPEWVEKVILESASPGLKTAADRAERREQDELLAQELERGRFDEFIEKWYRNPLFTSLRQHPDFHNLRQRRLQNDPRELAQSLRAMGTGSQPSLWDALKLNKIPLLLLTGEFDIKFRRIAAEMAAICPAAQVKVISGCGHNVHFENKEEFVLIVRNFIIQGVFK